MPRKPRFFLPKIPALVVQSGHSGDQVFNESKDYIAYLGWLQEAAERYGVKIHAYTLLPSQVQILMTPARKDSASRMMQYIGRRYVPYVNETYNRTGTLWEGRFKASLIDPDSYLLPCHCYVETAAVRDGAARTALQYKWSSHKANRKGTADPALSPHDKYLALGKTAKSRASAYADIFSKKMEDDVVNELTAAWRTGTPIGSLKFKARLESRLKMKVGYSKRGRPPKTG